MRDEWTPAARSRIGRAPLTAFVDRRQLLTPMTLRAAPELMLGYLGNRRLVDSTDELAAIRLPAPDEPAGRLDQRIRVGLLGALRTERAVAGWRAHGRLPQRRHAGLA